MTYNNTNYYNGEEIFSSLDFWLEANCEYEGYSEWTYVEEGDDTYSITYNEAGDCYDVSSLLGGLELTGASDSEVFNYFN